MWDLVRNIYFLIYIFYSFLWWIFRDIKAQNLLWKLQKKREEKKRMERVLNSDNYV